MFQVNQNDINDVVLVFLILTLNYFTFFLVFLLLNLSKYILVAETLNQPQSHVYKITLRQVLSCSVLPLFINNVSFG